MNDSFKKKYVIDIEKNVKDNVYIIDKDKIFEAVSQIKESGYELFCDLFGMDYLEYTEKKPARFAIGYSFRDSKFNLIALKVYLDEDDLEIDSIVSLYKGANWSEREVYDQYGIIFKGHPNLKRVLNHKQFVGHPLRRDYEITKGQLCTQTDDLMDQMLPRLESKGLLNRKDEFMFLNLGPSHPATHGTIRHFVALDGEEIQACVTEIGYLHRGFEKSCENHTYNQIIPYTDRLNYTSAILNNIGYVKTVEEMLGIEITERAKFIRVIVGEMYRAIDHLVCNGPNLVDLGALTNYWYLYNPRETAYKLLARLTGARLTNSYTRIGGLSHDLYDGFEEDLKATIKDIRQGISDTMSLIAHNKIFHDRSQGVGVITQEQALSYGITGPNLRATGIPYDVRKAKPYYNYDAFDFDIPVGTEGDMYDRIMVRFEEIEQSLRICEQAMKMIPDGPINVDDRAITLPPKNEVYNTIEGVMNQFKLIFEGVKVPKGEHYSVIEGANGELGFYIISDGSGTPYRVRVRPPCFYSLSSYPEVVEGGLIADAIVTMASMSFVAGEFDR